jgi:hypothetical protein
LIRFINKLIQRVKRDLTPVTWSKNNILMNGGDRKAGRGRPISRNSDEWIGGACGGSMMVEKETDEIGRMGRLKKQGKDGMKSRKGKAGIEKVGRGRGRWMTRPRNVEADGVEYEIDAVSRIGRIRRSRKVESGRGGA